MMGWGAKAEEWGGEEGSDRNGVEVWSKGVCVVVLREMCG
jgi:hypothetical protein